MLPHIDIFLSTLPAWGATGIVPPATHSGKISIHAPRVGSDMPEMMEHYGFSLFLSTLPAWGATRRWSCQPRD